MGPQCELTFNASANHLETHWSSSCSLKRRFQVQVRVRKILVLRLSFTLVFIIIKKGQVVPLTGHTSLRAENKSFNVSVS